MELISELLKISLPAGLVIFAMYLLLQNFFESQKQGLLAGSQTDNQKVILPIKLQAYERLCILLERMSLQQLLLRNTTKANTSGELHALLLQEIRDEYHHNISQQLYISNEAWTKIVNIKEQNLMVISEASQQVDSQKPAIELGKTIMNQVLNQKNDYHSEALTFLKNEARATLHV